MEAVSVAAPKAGRDASPKAGPEATPDTVSEADSDDELMYTAVRKDEASMGILNDLQEKYGKE